MTADRESWKSPDWALLAGYAVLLLCLLPIRPLWLDELMEVVGSAGLPLRQVVSGYAAHSAGQSPLAAIEQACAINLLGFSTFAARLPAALASLLACVGMIVMGRRSRFERPWLHFVILASLPLVLRYGSEDRPYSQALCIAVWLTVVFLELLRTPAWHFYAIYAVLLLIGLYTQPYVLFVALSQAVFLITGKRWALLFPLLGVMFVSVCAYLPWYFHSRAFWRQEVERSQLHFYLQPKLALLIPRELTGAGYAGSVVLILLSVYGFRSLRRQDGLLWTTSIVLPIVLVALADLVFDYFFAIRQIIFVLPPLAIASAAGLERLWREKGQRLAVAVLLAVLALQSGYAIRWFTKPGEDWSAAARSLTGHTKGKSCFVSLPADSREYYEFFQPALRQHECPSVLDGEREVALAISPYLIDRRVEAEIEQRLRTAGFVLESSENHSPEIKIYVRAKAAAISHGV